MQGHPLTGAGRTEFVVGCVLSLSHCAALDRCVPQAACEGTGGSLVVGGLCLLGFGLPLFP